MMVAMETVVAEDVDVSMSEVMAEDVEEDVEELEEEMCWKNMVSHSTSSRWSSIY